MEYTHAFFGVIPFPVLDNRQLPATAKMLYVELSSLATETGYCWATNAYLAERLGCGERTISRYISALEKMGVVAVETVPNAEKAGGKERRIYVGCIAKIGGTAKNGDRGIAKNGEAYLYSGENTVRDNKALSGDKEIVKKTTKRKAAVPAWEPNRFEEFWDLYRRKIIPAGRYPSRADAAKEWDKLKPDAETIAAIGKALKAQMQSKEWKRGIGIPDPCRYLSHRRWEDVTDVAAPSEGPRPRRYVRTEVDEDGNEFDIYE